MDNERPFVSEADIERWLADLAADAIAGLGGTCKVLTTDALRESIERLLNVPV